MKLKVNLGFLNKYQHLFKTRLFKYGAPFFLFVIGGSIYLNEFKQLKYKYGKRSSFLSLQDVEDLAKDGIFVNTNIRMKPKSEKTILKEAYKEMIEDKDLDAWENKRIPRPWDENFPEQEQGNKQLN